MKKLTTKQEAREKLKAGIDKLEEAVGCTLGPKGRYVVIQNLGGTPNATKDGVTVAKSIHLEDPVEDLGASIAKQASQETMKKAGDGTTTSIVLAKALVEEGNKLVQAGINPIDIKRGMDKAIAAYTQGIESMAITIDEDPSKLKQVATISANNDEHIGNLIAEAMEMVSKDGVITVENSNTTRTYIEKVNGLQFDRGWISPYFVKEMGTKSSTLENPYILIYDKKIIHDKQIIPALEIAANNNKPLLIICEDVEGQALSTIIYNKLQGNVDVVAVKAPWFGKYRRDAMEDIALVTGATVISEEMGMSLLELTEDYLGQAKKSVTSPISTTIFEGYGDTEYIDETIESLRNQLDLPDQDDFSREKLRDRIAKLIGGVAVLYVGAHTEVELRDKKDLIDDALHATKAAIKEGILPGGGTALLKLSQTFEVSGIGEGDEQLGVNIVKKALSAPLRKIAENAGKSGDEIITRLRNEQEFNVGYNAATDNIENLVDSGIIDPAMVTRLALQNAGSVAGILLMSEAVISFPMNNPEAAYGIPTNPNP